MSMEHWRNDTERRTLKCLENNCLSQSFQSQIPHGLTWDSTRASAVEDRLSNRLSNNRAYIQCDLWPWGRLSL